MRIGEDESELTVYDISLGSKLNPVISILNQKLSYDFYPEDEVSQSWVIVACDNTPQCHTYKIDSTGSVTPQSKRVIEGTDDCASKVAMVKNYVMLQCGVAKSMTLHLIEDYVVSEEFYRVENMLTEDATLTQFDEEISMVHLTESYDWSQGQADPMTFIDSISIVKTADQALPAVIYTEKHLFYEKHAN